VDPQLEDRIGRVLARWVGFVGRRPFSVILVTILAAAGVLLYASGHLGIEGATEQLFAPDLPFKQAERRYHEAFPAQYENLFVVVDAVTPERAGEAAAALLARMQGEPRFFREAYLPGGGEFFEEHAFLYLDTAELEDLADRLAENQPYLAELSRDGSLNGLTSMMARGVRAVREGDVSGSRLQPMFDHFADALDALVAGETYHLSWAAVLSDDTIDADARRRFLLVQPVLDFNDLQPAKRSILAVRRIAHELMLTPENGVRVRITGDAALSYEEMEVVRTQAAMAGIASFVLVGLILILALRSLRLVISTLLTLVVGLVFTAGFTAVAIGHFNLISVSFAVLFIGLGVDFGIHMCIRYNELLGRGRAHADALLETTRDVGSSILLHLHSNGLRGRRGARSHLRRRHVHQPVLHADAAACPDERAPRSEGRRKGARRALVRKGARGAAPPLPARRARERPGPRRGGDLLPAAGSLRQQPAQRSRPLERVFRICLPPRRSRTSCENSTS